MAYGMNKCKKESKGNRLSFFPDLQRGLPVVWALGLGFRVSGLGFKGWVR